MSDTNETNSALASNVPKSPTALREEAVLAYWHENHIFQQSIDRDAPNGEFVFYDGPPFATGLPHYGHLLAGTIKDVIPRYKTMQGYRVPRRWGWDCHGLPIENLIEKELDLGTKKDIEDYGIDAFNEAARASVLRYDQQWKEVIPRTGRFVDMDNAYVSMDPKYTESVWWVFSELYRKGLVSEGFKSMYLCPRCETTLANFEVNQGYMDVKDLSATAKFFLVDEPDVAVLAWTTTPWTLPGNVALAVGPDVTYARVAHTNEAGETATYIVANELVEAVFTPVAGSYEIIDTMLGSVLVGKKYQPIFSYYATDDTLDNRDNGWQIYPADFVTTEDGTGVVHIAPAFGSDDYELLQQFNLPFVQHVDRSGAMKPEVTDFAGLKVKEKNKHMDTDIQVVKWLAHNNALFSKLKITHSYPHCWRCDTPLINYATSSWFIDVPAIKEKLMANNQGVGWVPKHIQSGRFGKWLEGAREWAVSRSRYWGAVLPVWKSADGKEVQVVDSYQKLRDLTPVSGNTYLTMRHGEADNNVQHIISSRVDNPHSLTDTGRAQVAGQIEQLRSAGVTRIIASPFLRTRQTAELVATSLGLDSSVVIFDDRLVEVDTGTHEGQSIDQYHDEYLENEQHSFTEHIGGADSFQSIKSRVGEVLFELEKTYHDEVILILSHATPLWLLTAAAAGHDAKATMAMWDNGYQAFGNAEVRPLDFVPYPHSARYEFDVHRPYIDQHPVVSPDSGQPLTLVGDVFDVWFESGSMPYGQLHYPFENKELFDSNRFPANFIAEGLDQTRGWFYVMLVLGTALFDRSPFENVIVNGMILAEDGKKMSKRLGNYPPVADIINAHGADALRLFLMSSPAVRGEEVNLSEKAIREVTSKVVGRLWNIVSFYETYGAGDRSDESTHVLDRWIHARAAELTLEMTRRFDSYEIDRATRPLFAWVDDLSTWWLRRSRDRFKSADAADAAAARGTLHDMLTQTALLIAPVMPFLAESIWQKLGHDNSVHLANWPQAQAVDQTMLDHMQTLRDLVTQSLQARAEAGLKVRQPLASVSIPAHDFGADTEHYHQLLADELNVKAVLADSDLTDTVSIDTTMTPELEAEGDFREITRLIQSARKAAGMTPDQSMLLEVMTDGAGQKLLQAFDQELRAQTSAADVVFRDDLEAEPVTVRNSTFALKVTPR